MYAVVKSRGKQLKLSPGERIRVDKMKASVGDSIAINEVLLISRDGKDVHIGTPFVEGASVDGKVIRHARGKKVTIMKYKPKKRYRIKKGHRQDYTLLEITSVKIGSEVITGVEKPKAVKAAKPKAEKTEKPKAEKATGTKAAKTKKTESKAKHTPPKEKKSEDKK